MAKAFSVLSWNVEHFGAASGSSKPKKDVEPIIDLIAAQNADVVAISEVVGKYVYSPMVKALPNHFFFITEGPQSQEILVGVRKTLPCFFTQQVEFKAKQSTLRPGALVTLQVDGEPYPLLFLHLKSMPDPMGFGLRDYMVDKAVGFRKFLDKAAGGVGKANYIFMGDLNTMGLNLTYSDQDLSGPEEVYRLGRKAGRAKMDIMAKNEPATYWPGSTSNYPVANLDHVVAAEHLQFKDFGGSPIKVIGWPQESTPAKKDAWAKKFSDHAMLYFEVQKV